MTDEPLTDAPDTGAGAGTRRTAVVFVVAIAVAALLGGSAFAIYRVFLNAGPQPAEALPADTLAVVSIDLNPSAKQKIAAIKTIRKFPALKEELGLDADDDLRRYIFEKATEEGDCKELDYEKEVEPWLGKRAAFAAVDAGGDEPSPVLALQITDAGKAKSGIDKIVDCGEPGEEFGYATTDDYLIISDSTEHAEKIVADAKSDPLSGDAAYQKWTGEAGDAGVVNFYVSKTAAAYFADNVEKFSGSDLDESSKGSMTDAIKDFEGLAGTVRFADGGMELAVTAGGTEKLAGGASANSVSGQVGDLPADTAMVLGFGVPEDFVENLLTQLENAMGEELSSMVEQIEGETGLELPADVQTLLGESVSLSLGGDAPASLSDLEGPGDVPLGLLISGDEDEITSVITKVEEATGMSLSDIPLQLEKGDGKVVLSSTDDYAAALLEDGGLADAERFKKVIPEVDKAASVLFVDFDSAWADTIMNSGEAFGADATEVEQNLKPLEAFGISGWFDGGTQHVLLKITTN